MPKIKGQPIVGAMTSEITNKRGELVSWSNVQDELAKGEKSINQISKEFALNRSAIMERARRWKWRYKTEHEIKARKKIEQKAINWAKRCVDHRDLAFQIAHKSVGKFKPTAPKNFRELEAADRIARRAAGLDNDEVKVQTLVHINEAGDLDVREIGAIVSDQDKSEETLAISDSAPIDATPI